MIVNKNAIKTTSYEVFMANILESTPRNFKISYVLQYIYMSIKFTDISGLTSNTPISSAICFSIDTDSSI